MSRLFQRFGLLLALGYCLARPVFACDVDALNLAAPNQTENVFNACTQPVPDDLEFIYTWGHQNKLAELRRVGYEKYAQFNNENNFVFAALNFQLEFQAFPTRDDAEGREVDPFDDLLQDLQRTALGLYTVGQLHGLAMGNEAEQTNIKNDIKHRWIAKNEGLEDFDESSEDLDFVVDKALQALAYDQIIPGFIEDFAFNADKILDEVREDLKREGLREREIRALQGRELGVTRFLAKLTAGDKHRSNIAYGPGIYFSEQPYTSINHFYNRQHAGFACRLNGVQLTNLHPIKSQLIEGGFYFRDGTTDPARIGSYPTGRNELKDPAEFRRSSIGRLIRINNVFIDVGAIRYQQEGVCEPIELRHFKSCDGMVALINNSQFYGGSENGLLYDYLTQRRGELQMLQFKSRLLDCGKSYFPPETAAPETDPSVDLTVKRARLCQTFSYADHKSRALYRSEKEFFEYLRKNFCAKK